MKKSFNIVFERKKMNHTPNFLSLFVFGWCFLLATDMAAQWRETGEASYYADKFHGRPTASGEKYNKNDLTAAHRTLPIGSIVRVTRLDNEKQIEVRINDCGPHKKDRIIDLSKAAAKKVGLLHDGVAQVRVDLVQPGEGHCACDRKKYWDLSEWATPEPEPAHEEMVVKPSKEAPARPVAQETEVPVKVTPAPKPETAPVIIEMGTVLQLGAFGVEANAQKLLENVKKEGFEKAFIKEFPNGAGAIFRVYAGTYANREAALEAKAVLKNKMGIDGLVTELKPEK